MGAGSRGGGGGGGTIGAILGGISIPLRFSRSLCWSPREGRGRDC